MLVARARRASWREVVAAIRAAGGEAHAIAADVGDSDATHAIAGQAAAAVGPIDVLVNNASTLGPVPLRLLLDTDCEDLERALAVNLVGPFRLTKAIAGPMVLRGARDDRQRHLRRGDRGVPALGRLRRVEGGAGAAGADLGGGAGGHRRARAERRPGRDGHAHARRRDPRRRPRRRWPIRRASRRAIVALLQAEPGPRAGRARRDPRAAPRARRRRHEARDDISRRGATTCACWSIDPAAPADAALRETRTPALPDFLAAGDLLVVNDAATLPASLRGRDDAGRRRSRRA